MSGGAVTAGRRRHPVRTGPADGPAAGPAVRGGRGPLADRRIAAGVDTDGAFWDALPADGLGGRPFLMLGTDDEVHRPGGTDRTWDRTWPALGGWKRWLTGGADHFGFCDGPRAPAAHRPAGRGHPGRPRGGRDPACVAAFFDEHPRGVPQPLLAGPGPAQPAVRLHSP